MLRTMQTQVHTYGTHVLSIILGEMGALRNVRIWDPPIVQWRFIPGQKPSSEAERSKRKSCGIQYYIQKLRHKRFGFVLMGQKI